MKPEDIDRYARSIIEQAQTYEEVERISGIGRVTMREITKRIAWYARQGSLVR